MRDPAERLRDMLEAIDTEIVWKTVSQDVPRLKPALEKLLEKLERQKR